MSETSQTEIACNHWVAQVRAASGNDVAVHIHRGSPIPAKDALQIARKVARFGKVASLAPLGRCQAFSLEDDD